MQRPLLLPELASTTALAVLSLGAVGCERSFPCGSSTNMSTGEASGMATHAAWDAGPVNVASSFSLASSASVDIADVTVGGTTPTGACVSLDLSGKSDAGDDVDVWVGFDCVVGPGVYPLADLHATGCILAVDLNVGGGRTCGPIVGTLTVRAIARPCGEGGGCGHLHADIVMNAAPSSGLTLSGQATLAYDDVIATCQEPLVGWPGGG
jgi:hypothetical protein